MKKNTPPHNQNHEKTMTHQNKGSYYDKYNDEFDEEFGEDQQDDQLENESSDFARMMEESLQKPRKKFSIGDKVRCELLTASSDEIFFSLNDSGMPLEGALPKKELLNEEKQLAYKAGDFVELYITQIRGGKITLSTTPSAKAQGADFLTAFQQAMPIEGKVLEQCKGGVTVSLKGKKAFCPISQLDLSRVENPDDYKDQKFDFLITQYSEGGRNIVVSRRKLLQAGQQLEQQAFCKEKKEGDIVTGTIKKISPIGAFVEIAPGIEGLLHISELSWSRVASPQEVVSLGQVIQVKILKMEKESADSSKRHSDRLKISLSLKQASAEPWSKIPESSQIKEGVVVAGKVIRCMKFGAFVEISPGIEGLIPLSEMSYTKRVVRSDELFQEGDKITVMIKEIHPETKRILLSLRDAGVDPWALVPQKFPIGAIVQGLVERKEPFGIFIQLEEGVIGLLHKSKAAESPDGNYDKLKSGETVMVQIGAVDPEERRISLQFPRDPEENQWQEHLSAKKSDENLTLGSKFKNLSLKNIIK